MSLFSAAAAAAAADVAATVILFESLVQIMEHMSLVFQYSTVQLAEYVFIQNY